MKKIVDKYTAEMRELRTIPIVSLARPIDTRFGRVRTQETNIGSFTADLLRSYCQTDIALVNSGTFRKGVCGQNGFLIIF